MTEPTPESPESPESPAPGIIESAVTPGDPDEVTDARARMLALHAIHVQGGYSVPERERARAAAQLNQSPRSIDWAAMGREVDAELARQLRAQAIIDNAPGLVDFIKITEAPADDDAPPLEPGEGSLPVAKLRRYVELRTAQTASEAEAKALKDEANALEGELVDAFAEAGMQNVSLDGKTVYLHRSTFAVRKEGCDTETLKQALRDSGAGDIVTETVNSQTLNAWVRELMDDDDAPGLPEPVRDLLDLGERFAVRVTASGSKAKRR